VQTTNSTSHRRYLADLHRLVEQAASVLGLSDAVLNTAHDLINGIPKDAPEPISPANVTSLAERRATTPRTIHNRVKALIRMGIARNRCMDGGRRYVARNRQGAVTDIYGIDFTPLVERADELRALEEARKAEIAERARLRHEISRLRAILRRMVEGHQLTHNQISVWQSLPRRVAHLTLDRLKALWKCVTELIACGEQPNGSEEDPDRPEKKDRPYTTHQEISESCNPPMAAEKMRQAATCGLEPINLRMVLAVMPYDWQVAMERYGRADWNSFTNVAYEKAAAAGISPSAWSMAQAAIGRQGAAILVLIALTDAADRGGRIANPGGWVRRMAERAEGGMAHIHRSVFGLLNREENPRAI
jgi:hypothetical protein